MIDKLAALVWMAIEKIYAIPDDLFDFENDENAIIEE